MTEAQEAKEEPVAPPPPLPPPPPAGEDHTSSENHNEEEEECEDDSGGQQSTALGHTPSGKPKKKTAPKSPKKKAAPKKKDASDKRTSKLEKVDSSTTSPTQSDKTSERESDSDVSGDSPERQKDAKKPVEAPNGGAKPNHVRLAIPESIPEDGDVKPGSGPHAPGNQPNGHPPCNDSKDCKAEGCTSSATAAKPQARSSILNIRDKPNKLDGRMTVATVCKASQGQNNHMGGHLFADANAMKDEIHQNLTVKEYNVEDFYHPEGHPAADLARNDIFQGITLGVISINAIWIGVEADHNKAPTLNQADVGFQIGEHFFCIFFTFELMTRFFAFQNKLNCLRDSWFKFDSILVGLMVLETWIITAIIGGSGSGLGDVSMLRLLRLLRLSRMARLMRAVPELMIIVRGMAAATRSVSTALVLLVLIKYIFAIIFKVQLGEDESVEHMFGTIPLAMWTLLLNGTFLDNITDVGDAIKEASPLMAGVFIFFVIISAIMVMNMLIGILCEVIGAVAEAEKEKIVVNFAKDQLLDILADRDADGDQCFDKAEFAELLQDERAQKAITELGVDTNDMASLAETVFSAEDKPKNDEDDSEEEEPVMGFADFMEMLLQLRSTNSLSVGHLMDLRKYVNIGNNQVIDFLKNEVAELKAELYEIKTGEKPTVDFLATIVKSKSKAAKLLKKKKEENATSQGEQAATKQMTKDATSQGQQAATTYMTKDDVANLQKSIDALRMELAEKNKAVIADSSE